MTSCISKCGTAYACDNIPLSLLLQAYRLRPRGTYVLLVVNEKVLDMNEVEVNGKLISLDAFAKLDKSTVLTFDASDCTSLASLDLPAATSVHAIGCTSLVSLNLPAATYVYARDCTSLVSLDLPAVTELDIRGCPNLSPDVISKFKVQCGENLIMDAPSDHDIMHQ